LLIFYLSPVACNFWHWVVAMFATGEGCCFPLSVGGEFRLSIPEFLTNQGLILSKDVIFFKPLFEVLALFFEAIIQNLLVDLNVYVGAIGSDTLP